MCVTADSSCLGCIPTLVFPWQPWGGERSPLLVTGSHDSTSIQLLLQMFHEAQGQINERRHDRRQQLSPFLSHQPWGGRWQAAISGGDGSQKLFTFVDLTTKKNILRVPGTSHVAFTVDSFLECVYCFPLLMAVCVWHHKMLTKS